ncbi:hypothetical protein IAT38_006126 [Cryptococcus sp. DSM 104549]
MYISTFRRSSRSNKSISQVLPEEDAAKLQFGDFADGEALTLPEVATLLVAARQAAGVPPAPQNKVYQQTTEYVEDFACVDMELSESMRSALMLETGFLNKFEIAQIMTLRPERIDVAVALIPSLERYAQGGSSGAQLQQALDDVSEIVRYGKRS